MRLKQFELNELFVLDYSLIGIRAQRNSWTY